ncbi:MAG: proton-conducting transporter membrane subunit, partial [Gammaproteobacteria bacterium]
IKVRLAWSTCAQMGFLLMEVGLGLYDLALLHLVAHSLYKAHAFLAAGDTVAEARRQELVPLPESAAPDRRALLRMLALPASFAIVGASALPWQGASAGAGLPLVSLGIVGVGLAPLLWADDPRGLLRGVIRAALLTQIYLLWHYVFAQAVPPAPNSSSLLLAWVAVCFGVFYGLQVWITAWPDGEVARALHPRAYAGFWLDERFTRAVFRLWPPRPRTTAYRSATPWMPPHGRQGENP